MRKKLIICLTIGIVLVVLCGVLVVIYSLKQPHDVEVKEFSLMDYQWEIENFSSDNNVGQVDDVNIAIEKAKELWIEKFNVSKKKVEVFYDSNEECWHIRSKLNPNIVGGAPHAIIKRNGEVIAIWVDD